MSLPPAEILERLAEAGAKEDDAFDIEETALLAALCERPGLNLGTYRKRIAEFAEKAEGLHQSGEPIPVALANAIGGAGLTGDVETYDDVRNADLAWTLDRKCGLPVTLGLVYLSVARRHGWTAAGLAFPGHFLIGVHGADGADIIDPFRGGARRTPEELEALLRVVTGGSATLGPDSLRPVHDRVVIERMLRNLETRLVEPKACAAVAARRRRVSPKNVLLVLHAAQRALDAGWHREAQDAFSSAMLAAADDPGSLRKAESGRDAASRRLN